jgi:branched-chain amino acid transport system ATP-binding protein
MLRVENLHAWYDQSHVLHGVTLQGAQGEIVTLLGRNQGAAQQIYDRAGWK